MSVIGDDDRLLAVRHLLAGHGIRGAARATGLARQTIDAISRRLLRGDLASLVAQSRKMAAPSALDAATPKRRARIGDRDDAHRVVEALPAQVKPHPLRPDPLRRRGRPLQTESGKTISHEELLVKLVVRQVGGFRGMGEGAGI